VDPNFSGTVTLAIAKNPSGGTLGGNLTAVVFQGLATFAGLTLNVPGNGYILHATCPGLTAVDTNPIDVAPVGVASQLVVTTQPPATVWAGNGFGLTVKAEDISGNVDTNFNGDVTIPLPAGSASLGTNMTVPVKQGVASFTGLTVDSPGLYALTASAPGLAPATTTTFEVTAAPATQLVIWPTLSPVFAGSPFTLTVYAEDPQGNIDTNFKASLAIGLHDNPAGATLGGTLAQPAVNGVFTFTGLTLDKAGNGFTLALNSPLLPVVISPPFDSVTGALAVTTQPPGTTTVNAPFGLTAKVYDGAGHVLTSYHGSVTLALNDVGFTGGTVNGTLTATCVKGVATFTGLSVDTPGTYSLSLSGSGLAGIDSNAIVVTGGKASQLVVTTQPPSTVTAGTPFEVDVSAEDGHGYLDPHWQGSVTLALSSNPGGASLSGVRTVRAVGGVARFTGLELNKAASGYTLRSTSAGVSAGASSAFAVTAPGVAAQLVVTTPLPSAITAGDPFGFVVAAEDSSGTIDTSFNGQVTAVIANGPALGGTVTVAAVKGVATFSGLTLTASGSYELTASSAALVPATTLLMINAGPAKGLVISGPTSVTMNAPFTFVVLAVDAHGNPDFTFNGSIKVALHDNPGNATLGGTTFVQASNGVAVFTDLTLDQLGTGYTLRASGVDLIQGISAAFAVT
jgi:hypothetical protein